MNSIEIFKNERFGEIRVAGTSDEPLFCLSDVCRAIGISNVGNVKIRLDDDDVRLTDTTDSLGRAQQINFITESGLYDVIIRSDSGMAKPFRKWITSEVLPSIRKTGSYSIMGKVPTTFAEALRLAAEQQEQKNKKISDSLKGHAVSIETKRKISETIKNKILTKDENLKGLRSGRLTIIEEVERRVKPCGQKERMVRCVCDCGGIVEVRLNSFLRGRVKSCGCLKRECFSKRMSKHGLSSAKINNVYRSIKSRCYNKNCEEYKNYGGRGIQMCDEWKNNFMSFYNWAINNGYDSNKTIKEQSIDRINVDGDYEPSNCRIVNCNIQARNKRKTKKYLYIGELLDLKTISEKTGINYNTLWQRINKYGYTFENALF